VVWLASELMFFAGLFAAYFTLRAVNDSVAAEGVELATARTAAATVVLVASAGRCTGGSRPARREDRRRAAAGWGSPR
jgi:cytochrome c oxidase subunit 3